MNFFHLLLKVRDDEHIVQIATTHGLTTRDSHRQRNDVHGYAKLLPVFDVGNISAIKMVESNYHSVLEISMGLLSLIIVSIPVKEVAHAVELFYNASINGVVEFWILCKKF